MQQMVVKGKNLEIAESLRDYVEKKLNKLDRLNDKISAVQVEFSTEPTKAAQDRQVVQVTVQVNGTILRAEEASSDMFAAVDAVVDKIERRMERYKEKFYHKNDIRKNRRDAARSLAASEAVASAVLESQEDDQIVRTKHFQIKPMSPSEAVEQMELLGHDFYIFYNEQLSGVNVVYKRNDGTYGLLVPEQA